MDGRDAESVSSGRRLINRKSSSLQQRFCRNLLRKRAVLLITAFIIGAAAVPGLFRLESTVNMEDYFLEDDPVLKNQERFKRLFPNNEFVGVLVEAEDIFSRQSLEKIKETGDLLLQRVPGAFTVISPVHNSGLSFEGGRLSADNQELAAFKEEVTENSIFRGTLFSPDNKQAWIQLQLADDLEDEERTGDLSPLFTVGKRVYETVRSLEEEDGIRLTAAGVPVFAYRKEKEMMQDLMRIVIIASIALLFLSVIIMRSVQGVAGTFLVTALSAAVVFGIEGWAGLSVDSAFMAVPVLLTMGVSIGYTVHISRFFNHHYAEHGDRKGAAAFALEKTIKPIFFTAVTTIAGLLSFLFVEIQPIRWLGVTSAFSILAVFLNSVLFFPAVLSLGRSGGSLPVKEKNEGKEEKDILRRLLLLIARIVLPHRKGIFLLFLALAALTVPGLMRITVDFDARKMMGSRLAHMKDQIRIGSSSIASSETMELVLLMPRESFLEPEHLTRLSLLEEKIRKLPLVGRTTSISGILRDMNYMLHQRQEAYRVIPEKKSHVRYVMNVLKSTEPRLFSGWVTGDYRVVRVFIELEEFSSKIIKENLGEIEVMTEALFPPEADYFFAGSTYQMAVMNQYVTKGLVSSVITALIMITIIMMILFGSVRTGLIAMVPNLFPVLVIGGVMGYFKLPLEFVTMTAAPMIMGLSVDDTIHLLSHLRDEYRRTGDYPGSIKTAFSVVGSAITETTVILCLTFCAFFFSEITSIRVMGFLVCIGLLSAYLADLFITPILLGKLKVR